MTIGVYSQHAYLAKINERLVLGVVRDQGPLSRADVARQSGLSAPTVSKAVASLLKAGLLEEFDSDGRGLGRPARQLRLATESAQVLGVVFDIQRCWVVSTGLDGRLHEERMRWAQTRGTYTEMLDTLADHARGLLARPGVRPLGIGVTVPGLIDHRRGLDILSPNVPMINSRSPGRDLGERLGLECVMVQDQDALCLAERHFGRARGLEDFAILDVSSGIGMGVVSGGRLLRGHSGFAGEIGHITVCPDGRPCGCGNRGCLETVACDTALARRVSRRLDRPVDIDEVVRLARAGEIDLEADIDEVVHYLAIGLAAVVNIFNPSRLFIHGQLFDADESLLERTIAETGRRALAPSFGDCAIVRAVGSKRQGAVASIIQHLMDSVAPEMVPS